MKLCVCLWLLIFVFIQSYTYAQSAKAGDSSYILKAYKKTDSVNYRLGTRMVLIYNNGAASLKARGVFVGVYDSALIISRNARSSVKTLIAVDSITRLRKINPNARFAFAGTGIALVAVGSAILDNESNNGEGSAIKGAFGIVIIGAGAFCIYAIPGSLLIEKLKEKNKSNGWMFSLEKP